MGSEERGDAAGRVRDVPVVAAGRRDVRAVTQRDYAAVMAYFAELAGEEDKLKCEVEVEERNLATGAALTKAAGRKSADTTVHLSPSPSPSSARSADERRRALWSLNLVEGDVAGCFGGRGEARSYADALFWNIHKTDRFTATARQVWAVIFALRSRARARRAKTAIGALGAADVH